MLIELADGNFTPRQGATLVTIERRDFWFAQYRGELVVSFEGARPHCICYAIENWGPHAAKLKGIGSRMNPLYLGRR